MIQLPILHRIIDRRPMVLHSCLPLLTWLFLVAFVQVCYADHDLPSSDEHELKAVYCYNFAHFVYWPAEKELKHSESVIISIVGRPIFGKALEQLQADLKKKKKKNITLVYHGPYQEGMDLSRSHLLFICGSKKNNFRKIIAGLKDAPVLTIADTDGFLKAGGMIKLVTRNNKVRWEINRASLRKAGLNLHYQLLELAVKIINNPSESEWPEQKPDGKIQWPSLKNALAMELGDTSGQGA